MVEATHSWRWVAVFYRCLECQVKLSGVNSPFRNPPVFLKKAVGGAHERRQAFLEIEVWLDHLFCRNKTPVHVAEKLMNVISQFSLRAKGASSCRSMHQHPARKH